MAAYGLAIAARDTHLYLEEKLVLACAQGAEFAEGVRVFVAGRIPNLKDV